MSEPRPEPDPALGPEPGDRPLPAARPILERPPSSRFEPRPTAPQDVSAGRRRTTRRAALGALGVALGVFGPVLLVGTLATTTGLLFVAGASGLIVGSQLRTQPAIALTLAAALGGDIGAWLISRAEGGVLELPAYAFEIFGVGLIGQVLVAAVAAAYASSSIRTER